MRVCVNNAEQRFRKVTVFKRLLTIARPLQQLLAQNKVLKVNELVQVRLHRHQSALQASLSELRSLRDLSRLFSIAPFPQHLRYYCSSKGVFTVELTSVTTCGQCSSRTVEALSRKTDRG